MKDKKTPPKNSKADEDWTLFVASEKNKNLKAAAEKAKKDNSLNRTFYIGWKPWVLQDSNGADEKKEAQSKADAKALERLRNWD
jgi:hypothetical protein